MPPEVPTLSEYERIALQKLMQGVDRGRAQIFVGRQAERTLIRNRLELLLERLDTPAPGAGLTTVIQGAPGAGKSALLEKIAEEWPLGGPGPAMAVSLDPGVLKLPMPDCLQEIAHAMAPVPGIARRLRQSLRSLSLGLPDLAQVEWGVESTEESHRPPVPVLLLFDEIQTELVVSSSTAAREHLTQNLRLLHTGRHRTPLFPIYGGLANSGDLLRAAGLTRLASGSERTLSRLSEEEMDEWMGRFVDEHLSSARPDPATLTCWGSALRRDSQGWPMHGRNFLIALVEEIRMRDWCPAAVDLDAVRRRAQRLRGTYYEHRLQGELEGRHALVSRVLESLERSGGLDRIGLVEAIDRAHRERSMPEGDRGALPVGLTAEQVLNQMLQAGLVQKTDDGRLTCPIPSLASHMAAKATWPPSPLHEAVLAASAEEVGQVMERCRQDAECGALLQATGPHPADSGGRTGSDSVGRTVGDGREPVAGRAAHRGASRPSGKDSARSCGDLGRQPVDGVAGSAPVARGRFRITPTPETWCWIPNVVPTLLSMLLIKGADGGLPSTPPVRCLHWCEPTLWSARLSWVSSCGQP